MRWQITKDGKYIKYLILKKLSIKVFEHFV